MIRLLAALLPWLRLRRLLRRRRPRPATGIIGFRPYTRLRQGFGGQARLAPFKTRHDTERTETVEDTENISASPPPSASSAIPLLRLVSDRRRRLP